MDGAEKLLSFGAALAVKFFKLFRHGSPRAVEKLELNAINHLNFFEVKNILNLTKIIDKIINIYEIKLVYYKKNN